MAFETDYLKDLRNRFDRACAGAISAIGQLSDEQIWFRSSSQSNSVGIIVQHLTGNLSQWVLDALGGREYKRNRPLEFEDSKKKSKSQLMKDFEQLGKDVEDVISKLSPDLLLSPRHIQDTDQTVLTALQQCITHMNLHTGQILYIAKMLLNEKYMGASRH